VPISACLTDLSINPNKSTGEGGGNYINAPRYVLLNAYLDSRGLVRFKQWIQLFLEFVDVALSREDAERSRSGV